MKIQRPKCRRCGRDMKLLRFMFQVNKGTSWLNDKKDTGIYALFECFRETKERKCSQMVWRKLT